MERSLHPSAMIFRNLAKDLCVSALLLLRPLHFLAFASAVVPGRTSHATSRPSRGWRLEQGAEDAGSAVPLSCFFLVKPSQRGVPGSAPVTLAAQTAVGLEGFAETPLELNASPWGPDPVV